jgi:hypothetical protein
MERVRLAAAVELPGVPIDHGDDHLAEKLAL